MPSDSDKTGNVSPNVVLFPPCFSLRMVCSLPGQGAGAVWDVCYEWVEVDSSYGSAGVLLLR